MIVVLVVTMMIIMNDGDCGGDRDGSADGHR